MLVGITFAHVIISLIIIAACIGILYVVCNVSGVWPPAWVIQIAWIVLVAVVAIVAIKFLISMW